MTGGDIRNELSGTVFGSSVQVGHADIVNFGGGMAHRPPGPPYQLPAGGSGFTNRSDEQRVLSDALGRHDHTSDQALVVVISGCGGVGKSALSVHWGHRVREHFPDGQLYVDLGGLRHGGGVEISDVVAGFLRALGVPEEAIPADFGGRVTHYRSAMADKACLILVDDAYFTAEVLPLIPASARCMMMVTSHSTLEGLIMGGPRPIPVPVGLLDERSSRELLVESLGEDRIAAEPEAVAELIRLCAGLPIALRVAAGRLLGHPVWGVAVLVDRLAENLLGGLVLEGSPVVTRIFDGAYLELPEHARSLYRRLGVCPGSDFTPEVAAAAAGISEGDVADPLDVLYRGSLLHEITPDHYRFHDLIRDHARGLGMAEDGTAALVRRVTEVSLRRAEAADQWIMDTRLRLNVGVVDPGLFTSRMQALDWLEAERSNLLAIGRAAADGACPELVPPLAQALWALFSNHSHHADTIEFYELGVRTAGPFHAPGTEAQMHALLARGLMDAGELDRAEAELAAAGRTASAHRRVEALVFETLGLLRGRKKDTDGAIAAFGLARTVNEELANPRGVGLQSYHIGRVLHEAGRDEEADRELTEARRIAIEIDRPVDRAKAEVVLGAVYRDLGRASDAVPVLMSAAEVLRARRMTLREAEALVYLADVHREGADDHLGRALALYEAAHHPKADEVRARFRDS